MTTTIEIPAWGHKNLIFDSASLFISIGFSGLIRYIYHILSYPFSRSELSVFQFNQIKFENYLFPFQDYSGRGIDSDLNSLIQST